MPEPRSTFARPWQILEHAESFEIASAGGVHLAYCYFEDNPTRRSLQKDANRSRPGSAQSKRSVGSVRRFIAMTVSGLRYFTAHPHPHRVRPASHQRGSI